MTLLDSLKPGDWIFLYGEMGAGKTHFTQNLCRQLDVTDIVTSPTFALMHVYQSEHRKIKKILHLDLYRIKHPSEIYSLGLEQEFDPSDTIVIIEWPSMITEEDWESFFEITSCSKPNWIHKIHVQH